MTHKVVTELEERIEEIRPELRRDRRGQPSGFTDRAGLRSGRDENTARAVAYWQSRGWTKPQARQFINALADLEEAWVVFAESGDPDRALWRLVDAAGQLAEVFPEERREPTGRGYRIEKVPSSSDEGHRWEK